MKALNISQLPRWKQDQIVINNLQRKVEGLTVQLERQAKAHEEDTRLVRNENAHLKRCVDGILAQLGGFGNHFQGQMVRTLLP